MPPLQPVASDPTQPVSTEVVVIGGGIVGVCTAFFLALQGVLVTLCEKGEIAAEQSGRNLGWCRTVGCDPREIPLAKEALRLWHDMNRLTSAETGFRRSGIIALCKSQPDLQKRESWLDLAAHAHGLDSRLITRDQAARHLPGLAGPWAGALFAPTDGRAEPAVATAAIAEAARRNGAAILTQTAVRGIEMRGGGIGAVVTEKGRIACDSVVLAGGVWSGLFAGSFGLRLPLLKVLSAAMRTAPLPGGPDMSVDGPGFGLRKRMDGGYTIGNLGGNIADIVPDSLRYRTDFAQLLNMRRGTVKQRLGRQFLAEWRSPRRWPLTTETPFERTRILDPEPHQPILEQVHDSIVAAFPIFHDMEIVESWAGGIDMTPDAVPVISAVDAIPGFFIATGFSGHGFGLAPGAGRLMAQLVMGDTPVVDPAPFRYSRFTDGSRPMPSPLV